MSTEPPTVIVQSVPVLASPRQAMLEEQARTRGYTAGYAAGARAAAADAAAQQVALRADFDQAMAAGAERINQAVAALAAAADALRARTTPAVEESYDILTASALDLAETILGIELADTDTSAKAAVTRALADVDPALVVTVRLHPDDLANVADADRVDGVTFTSDPTVRRGDAVTVFEDGYLDARIGDALSRARHALTGDPR